MKSAGFFAPRLLFTLFLLAACGPVVAGPDCQALIMDMVMGEPVPMEVMLDDLATVRIIYLGEVHSIPRHHAVQLELLQLLAQGNTKPALGMEMFSQDQQSLLDKWQEGNSDTGHLMRDLGREAWTNLKDYDSLLVRARDLKIPVVALNAPEGLVRKVSRNGVESLTESERRMLPSGYDTISPGSERLLRLRLRVHKAFQEKSLASVVMAQAIRDEAMAQAIVRFLASAQGQDRVMVVVAGAGHVNYGFGIPERVRKQIDLSSRIVLLTESGELVLSEEEKRQAIPVEITHEDLRFIRSPIADYLHVTPLKAPDSSPEGLRAAPEK